MLIGLTGYAQHGKDTIGRVLVDEFGFTRFAFADQVRELALRIDPIIPRNLDTEFGDYPRLSVLVKMLGWDEAKADPEVRRILVAVGMGVRNVIGEDAWVKAVDKLIPYNTNVVITDVRFPNEVEWLHANGGMLVKSVRVPDFEAVPHDSAAEQYIHTFAPDHTITANSQHMREMSARYLMFNLGGNQKSTGTLKAGSDAGAAPAPSTEHDGQPSRRTRPGEEMGGGESHGLRGGHGFDMANDGQPCIHDIHIDGAFEDEDIQRLGDGRHDDGYGNIT